jgi:hypothetical protein
MSIKITKDRKKDQVSIKYTIIPLQDPPKFTQILAFGSKTNHLATLSERPDIFCSEGIDSADDAIECT